MDLSDALSARDLSEPKDLAEEIVRLLSAPAEQKGAVTG
jgi:hypothetical protein